ncbi:sigma-54-dependent transcriptional regulator [Bacteroidota bacterium]
MNKKSKGIVLVVDDNQDVLNAIEILAEEEFDRLICIASPNRIIYYLKKYQIDVVLLDMNFSKTVESGKEGIFWLKRIQEQDNSVAVVLFTAFGDVSLSVKAMKDGAIDFVLKPWDNNKLLATLTSAVKLARSRRETIKLNNEKNILNEELDKFHPPLSGQSIGFKKLIKTINKTAPTEANILITGENGTGKSVIAREIHRKSSRKNHVFVTVDLGSISESLFESELFGHVKGAFTDAKSNRIGRIESASGGSLFLDEIGNLSSKMQMKLLNVLQEKKITPLGSNDSKPIDIRLITATNRNLEELIENNEFREDLYYRINTINIEIPPLRKRVGDIEPITSYFLDKFKKKYNRPELQISKDYINTLKQYNWPGNVRELEHSVEKSVILCETNVLEKTDIFIDRKKTPRQGYSGSLEEIEKQAIIDALERHYGSQINAARELNITRQTIYNKIKKYGL